MPMHSGIWKVVTLTPIPRPVIAVVMAVLMVSAAGCDIVNWPTYH
jgi:hypothetical protein